MEGDGGDLKRCPDCAELVRAQARVCRFCGYRFEGARGVAGGGGGVFGELLRRPRAPVPLPELLAGWGSELRPGETVEHFGYCQLDARFGFLLITSERVSFFAGRGGERVLEWPAAQVRTQAGRARSGRRWLRLVGPEGTVTLRRFGTRAALCEVQARLGGAPAP